MLPTVHYTIAMPYPETHLFHVTVEVRGWNRPQADLVLPAWTPGSYLIREFARHVEGFKAATGSEEPLRWQRPSKAHWCVETQGVEHFHVGYRVYANDLTVRTSHLDTSHGYFNGTNVFMFLDGFVEQPVTLDVQPPEGWQVSIALPQNEQGHYEASSYDLLADSPAEIGTHRVLRFEALGRPHEVALWGRGNEDEAALVEDLAQVVEAVAALFGGELPYERYLFIVHLGDRLGGGLEHLNSTTLAVDRWTFAPRAEYEKFLRLAAHEFFHTWNVKRLRPKELGPFDYTQEVYTPLLWVMEGFTTYYDALMLRRAGLVTPKQYLQTLGERIASYRQQPGRLVQSLEEASQTAWIKFYRQDENYVNSGISYYLKGSLVALMLDLHLRVTSRNQRTLDDVMRALWERFGSVDRGFTEAEFYQTVEGVGNVALQPFLGRFVRGVEELPLEAYLEAAGLTLVGTRKKESPTAWAGFAVKSEPEGVVVKHVLRGSPAETAGLMAKDHLLAVDGYQIRDEAFLTARLREKGPGDPLTLHLFRYGQLLERQMTLAEAPPDQVTLRPLPTASALQRQLLAGWLGAPWEQIGGEASRSPRSHA